MDSILDYVKYMIGVAPEDRSFDLRIITYINGAFATLQDMGAGPEVPFGIHNSDAVWSEWSEDKFVVECSKEYVSLRTQKLFDPPSSSYVLDALNKQIDESAWRLYRHCQREY